MKGRHDIRGGYFVNFMFLDHWQPETGNPRGRFEFRGNVTALNGGPVLELLQPVRVVPARPASARPPRACRTKLMTAREWQHALFIRDRWNVYPKLTVDLGLRWEYYPIMTRADGRGIDRLDRTTRTSRRLDVLIAGRGGNPQTSGMEASLGNFAPRAGAHLSRQREDGVPRRLRPDLNATPWARALRGDNDYPVTIASSFFNADQFAPYGTLAQGIPILRGPDQSTGRVPLDRSAAVYTPEVGNVDRGEIHTWNARSNVGCRSTRRWTSPTSAPREEADTPRSTSTRRRRSASATRAVRSPRSAASWRSTPGVRA